MVQPSMLKLSLKLGVECNGFFFLPALDRAPSNASTES